MAEYTLATIESENTNLKDWSVSGPIYQELFQSVADWATRLAREDAELRRQNSSLLRALCWLMNEPRSGAALLFAKKTVCEVTRSVVPTIEVQGPAPRAGLCTIAIFPDRSSALCPLTPPEPRTRKMRANFVESGGLSSGESTHETGFPPCLRGTPLSA